MLVFKRAARAPNLCYEVLDLLCIYRKCDLITLVRFSCMSKACQALCITLIQQHPQELVERALQDAASASKQQQHNKVKVLEWILSCINAANSQAVSALDASPLVATPHVPLAAATALVRSGLIITHQQLMSAAHECVAGVEKWLRAYNNLCLPNVLLPAWAFAVGDWSPQVTE